MTEEGFRLLVCGSREHRDATLIERSLDRVRGLKPGGIAVLIHGGARGADALADAWARSRGVPVESHPVDPRLDGPWPAAGPRRNARMLRDGRPHAVLAFPLPHFPNRGTEDMIRRATAAGLPVLRVLWPDRTW